MITKLHYDKAGQYTISGTIKLDNINFDAKDIDSVKFFPFSIQLLLGLKATLIKNLNDDMRILGDERIEVISSIDKFMTIIFALSFIISKDAYAFSFEYKDAFDINVTLSRMNYFNGSGKLLAVPSKDIGIDIAWFEKNIIESFKNIISLFSKVENYDKIKIELNRLLYNLFTLRYKIEFV
jgi:hypothetical protein